MRTRIFHGAIFCFFFCGISGAIYACEDEHPPVLREPSVEFTLRDKAQNPIALVGVDPRGMGRLRMADEMSVEWTRPEEENWSWDSREWQWWTGHPWGESCRPRFYAEVDFHPERIEEGVAWIDYHIDGFDCRQTFIIPDVVSAEAPYWDVVFRIRNNSGRDVEEYGQFFACYTAVNASGEERLPHWYWDSSGELVRWNEKGVDHLDGYIAHPEAYFLKSGRVPHVPRGEGRIVGTWRHPVLVSNPTPEGWRSVILCEEETTAALAQGMGGPAMDYILHPGAGLKVFADGEEFTAQIRHVLLKSNNLPETERLNVLWKSFEQNRGDVFDRIQQF